MAQLHRVPIDHTSKPIKPNHSHHPGDKLS
jgi:hypothetical protein